VLAEFTEFVERLELHAPGIPYVSNITGTWITSEEATSPDYWTRHLRQTVRFMAGLHTLLQEPRRALLEVGRNPTGRAVLIAIALGSLAHALFRGALAVVGEPYAHGGLIKLYYWDIVIAVPVARARLAGQATLEIPFS
jgi:acyl transferase domain-containing protein